MSLAEADRAITRIAQAILKRQQERAIAPCADEERAIDAMSPAGEFHKDAQDMGYTFDEVYPQAAERIREYEDGLKLGGGL